MTGGRPARITGAMGARLLVLANGHFITECVWLESRIPLQTGKVLWHIGQHPEVVNGPTTISISLVGSSRQRQERDAAHVKKPQEAGFGGASESQPT